MIRILPNNQIVEVLRERALSNGLFEVDLLSDNGKYRAIMSEIKVPGSALCAYLIEHLPKVGDLEEHEILDMAHAIMRGDKKSFTVNAVADAIPYLCRVNLISYQKKPTLAHGLRFFFRRIGTTDQIKNTLASPPSPPPLSSQEGGGDSSPSELSASETEDKAVEPTRKKKKKKKKKLTTEEPAKLKKKKKKKCCDNPHPVKSKKTGKRRCKNCGAKLGKKKKKVKL